MSDFPPLLSIITVVRNDAFHLEETFRSVLSLKQHIDFEYLVIDGKSTDDTIDVILKYRDIISYWISETDSGIYDAMNKGVRKSSGKVLFFLNSGDLIIVKGFLRLFNAFSNRDNSHKENCIYYGYNSWRGNYNPGLSFEVFFPAFGRLPSHQSMIIPKMIQNENLYNLRYPIAADQYFKLSIFHKGVKFIKVDCYVCDSLKNGVSQRFESLSHLKKRTVETYYIFSSFYTKVHSLFYSVLFFLWNMRKLFRMGHGTS